MFKKLHFSERGASLRGLYRAPKPTVLHWIYSASRILGHILTFPKPPCPAGLTKLVQNGLYRFSHIVLYVLCSTRTSGVYLRPSEVSFTAISSLSGNLFYIYSFFFKIKILGMVSGWRMEFFPFSQSLYTNEFPKLSWLAWLRYALKEKKRYYLGIFPKRRTPPPPPFGNPLSKKKF